jgi:hypothetical protein
MDRIRAANIVKEDVKKLFKKKGCKKTEYRLKQMLRSELLKIIKDIITITIITKKIRNILKLLNCHLLI